MTSGSGAPIAAAKRARLAAVRIGSLSAHSTSFGTSTTGQRVEHALARLGARHVGRGRQHQRERPRAGLRLRRRERRLVGGEDVVGHVARARALDEEPDRQVLGAADEVAERDPCVAHVLVAR